VTRQTGTNVLRNTVPENCALLSHYATSSGDGVPTFGHNLSVPSSGDQRNEKCTANLPEDLGLDEKSVHIAGYFTTLSVTQRTRRRIVR
jgi:hypothetical protein